MPCTDGGVPYPDHGSSLVDRNDELAQQLCRMGALLVQLEREGLINFSKRQHLAEQIEFKWAIGVHTTHRNHDREVAKDSATAALHRLKRKQQQIEGLGGVIGDELKQEIDEATARLTAVYDSDPLDTVLY